MKYILSFLAFVFFSSQVFAGSITLKDKGLSEDGTGHLIGVYLDNFDVIFDEYRWGGVQATYSTNLPVWDLKYINGNENGYWAINYTEDSIFIETLLVPEANYDEELWLLDIFVPVLEGSYFLHLDEIVQTITDPEELLITGNSLGLDWSLTGLSASVNGMADEKRIVCVNQTTHQRVRVKSTTLSEIDCVGEGLEISKGDQVKIIFTGTVN